MKKTICMFCGEPATLLCDGIIGWDADEDQNGIIMNCRGMFTCDAPMCRKCATWHGNIFFRGKAGGADTRDLCPICQKLHNAGERIRISEHRKFGAIPEPCLTKEQAAKIRAAHWAGFANKHTQSIKILEGGGQQPFDF
ncbi:hypothetical protein FMK81_13055 [Klebsiella oxytoca]|uniref:hypothetical protein n=1 Tax=Klebsiella oxytoca TaxID=571 RepID=UPI001CCBBB3B|nr:hypothetical protein [Klebsiella oxytoca]MBZ7262438.1 hypothetical protein [Klebsiella oxytoca]